MAKKSIVETMRVKKMRYRFSYVPGSEQYELTVLWLRKMVFFFNQTPRRKAKEVVKNTSK